MKIGFIGAGKVGFTLGKYFTENGVSVSGYFSRNIESAKQAAVFSGTECFEILEEIVTASDILFLTVPDSAVKDLWNNLKTMQNIQGKIICHCSGLMSSLDFEGINEYGTFGYSVHPLFAISSKTQSYKTINQAVFTIEGNEKYLDYFKELFENLGNKVYMITADKKVKYHAAAVFLSNQVNALAHIGCKLLKECGFDEEFNKTALSTLFLNNCKAIAEKGAFNALTGPVERNDLTTIQKHMDCFSGNEKDLYSLLSLQLLEIAKEKHNDTDYSEIQKFLKEKSQ
ncbi:MAG: DUF2520 domain-containing protein [Ruminococcus sp.]|jgi:predicted short-subunit dehydrogenase-like oxidoreductase (DUF2520 family)|nr:DUF2520 domain-containing protein [Ruminococcus sp.]